MRPNRSRYAALAFVFTAITFLPVLSRAEVARVDLPTRTDVSNGAAFGSAGAYEQLVGKIYFAVDPKNPRNQVITDLDKAPMNASGRVEMSADLVILKPKDPAKGNGVALIDVVNRGNRTVITGFNRAANNNEFGDGFLMRMGYTIVFIGWEFDVPNRNGAIRIDVPSALGVTGMAHAMFTPNTASNTAQVADLAMYKVTDPSSAQNMLTVRDGATGQPTTIPRNKWTLNGNTVT